MASDELVLKISAQADQFKRELAGVQNQLDGLKGAEKSVAGIGAGFKSALPDISKFAVGIAAGGLALSTLADSMERVTAKETALAEFSAITGVTGAKLQEFGNIAAEMSSKFGNTAVDNIEAFKGVLSRLGPGFASSTEAVKLLGENINIMAKAGGIDAKESMDALTTVMLQFGIDLSDPNKAAAESTRIMNTLAAGAQQGAAEIPQVAEAMKQVGVMAKGLNQSIEGTNAALQILAAGGKYGSEAGVALRNTMALMVKASGPAESAMKQLGTSSAELGKLLTEKGLEAALVKLQTGLDGVKSDAERSAIMFNIFGAENAAAATILANSTKSIDGQASALHAMTTAVTGTNSAIEQFNVVSNTSAEKAKRFKAGFNNIIDSGTTKAMADTTGFFEKWANLFSTNGPTDSGFKNLIYNMTRAGMSADELAAADAALAAENARVKRGIDEYNKVMDVVPFKAQTVTNYILNNVAALKEQADAAKKAQAEIDKMVAPVERPKAGTYLSDLEDELKGFQEMQKFSANRKEWNSLQKEIDAVQKKMDAITGGKKKPEKKDNTIATRFAAEQAEVKMAMDWEENAAKQRADIWKNSSSEMNKALGSNFIRLFGTIKPMQAWAEAVRGVASAINMIPPRLNILGDGLRNIRDEIVKTLPSIAEALGTAIMKGTDPLKQAMKTVVGIVISGVEGMILAAAAASTAKAITSFGVTLITDAPWLAAAYAGLEVARGFINSLAVGTINVPADQIAQIHKGEMIIPRTFAESVRRGEATIGGNSTSPSKSFQRQGRPLSITASVMDRAFRSGHRRQMYYETVGAY